MAGIRTPGQDQPDARRAARGLRRSSRRSPSGSSSTTATSRTSSSPIERGKLYMLQTRSGKRTAPRRGEDRGRHGQRGDHHARGGAAAGRARARSCSCCCRASTRRPRPRPADRFLAKGLNASPGAAAGKADLRPGSGRGGQGGRRPGDPGAHRDQPGRRPRHAGGPGRADRPRRRDQPRRGGGALAWACPAWPARRRSRSTTRKREMQAGDRSPSTRAT